MPVDHSAILRPKALCQHDANSETRRRKATKIVAVLRDFLRADLAQAAVLDVGCAAGVMTDEIAKHCRSVVGIDMDEVALASAQRRASGNLEFVFADAMRIPFPDGAFDVAICAQVYEHVSDQPPLAAEIWRVLRPGGVCFFSGPNRLAFMEEHYWLPCLSWLPQSLADRYMRLFRRGQVYDIRPRFYWEIRRLWAAFSLHDYTVRMIREPQRFAVSDQLGRLAWVSRLPEWTLWALTLFLPNYNWILVKPAPAKAGCVNEQLSDADYANRD